MEHVLYLLASYKTDMVQLFGMLDNFLESATTQRAALFKSLNFIPIDRKFSFGPCSHTDEVRYVCKCILLYKHCLFHNAALCIFSS